MARPVVQTEIAVQLCQLTELYAHRDVLKIAQQTLIEDAIPEDVQIALADIDLEYGQKHEAIGEKIAILEQAVKRSVVDYGESVKTNRLHAVYNRGRMQWDAKGLHGYAVAHPEVGAFCTVGKPWVSLRRAK